MKHNIEEKCDLTAENKGNMSFYIHNFVFGDATIAYSFTLP